MSRNLAEVGSHNTLRWLDEPLRGEAAVGACELIVLVSSECCMLSVQSPTGLTAGMAAHYPLDDTGHTWRLKLDKLDCSQG